MKRFLVLLLSAVLLIGIIPMTMTLAASEDVSVSVIADKTIVNPGDEITFLITVKQTGNLAAMEMGLDIPTGLTYVANSGGLDAELRNKLNSSESLTFTEESKKIVWADPTNYWTSSELLEIATFKCIVNADADLTNYSIGLNEVQFCDENFEVRTHSINNATISVVVPDVAATGVTLNKSTLSLATGTNENLIATIIPDNATNKAVSWKSSDAAVAVVDGNGKVTAMKKGIATITATTEDGGFIDTCEVSVACAHANTTVHPAVESTCLIQGNNTYTTCNDCGIVISGTDEKLPFGSHKGGTATCKDKAVCGVCNQPYGDYASCQLTNHPHNKADHSKPGNIEYWTCDVCNKYFSDAMAKNEIRQEDTVINRIPHSYDTDWSYNTTQHWKECDCGAQTELAGHQFDNACDTTCNSGCGYTRTITHQWKATYSADDSKHWYECKVCGEKKDVDNHSGGVASCKEKAVCEVCDKAYGELKAHALVEKVDDKYLKAEASCVAKAVYYKSCSVCGIASTETFETGEFDDTNHSGETEVKDAVKETCTTDGYSGDIYCKGCGDKLKDGKLILADHVYGTTYKADAENHWKECSCGDITEKATHTFNEWTVTKEASTMEKGRKERVCSVCGYSELEETPMLETTSPKTGDYNALYLWLVFLTISCMCASGIVMKRKNN